MATSFNRQVFIKEARGLVDVGAVGTTYTVYSLNLASFRGYNFGNTAKLCTGTFNIIATGLRTSGTVNDKRLHSKHTVHFQRENAGAPTVQVFNDANNVGGVTVAISGNTLLFQWTTTGNAPECILLEIAGPIVDVSV